MDASGSRYEISLLTTQNLAFPKLLAILIRYKNQFPYHPNKYLQMDNAMEFRSHTLEDYCIATGITLTYCVPYEHFHNGLAKAFIKKIQLITRPLLLHAIMPPCNVRTCNPSCRSPLSITTHPSKHTHPICIDIWPTAKYITPL